MAKQEKKEKPRSEKGQGGAQSGGGAYVGGNVATSGGDFVGRDKTLRGGERSVVVVGSVSGSTIITGVGNVVTKTTNIFAPVYRRIEQSSRPAQEKEDLKAEVQEVEVEVKKGEAANEGFLRRCLRNLKRMAPEIAEVALSALSGPGAAVAAVVKKVAEKVKNER
jgi:hypothetical protein